MYVPDKLADRLIVVTRAEYVKILDVHTAVLRDQRATIVPYPLIGRWQTVSALAKADLRAGGIYLVDRRDPGRYMTMEEALRQEADEKTSLLFEVCQKLGATSMKYTQTTTQAKISSIDNSFRHGLNVRQSTEARKKKASIAGTHEFPIDFAVKLGNELKRKISIKGQWKGGPPDIEGAFQAIRELDEAETRSLRSLIRARSDDTNPPRRIRVHFAFLDNAQRDIRLVIQVLDSFQASLAGKEAQAVEKLSNELRIHSEQVEDLTFDLDVKFERSDDRHN